MERIHSIHNFLKQVEAQMASKGIVNDSDKIRYVKARVQGTARDLLDTSFVFVFFTQNG